MQVHPSVQPLGVNGVAKVKLMSRVVLILRFSCIAGCMCFCAVMHFNDCCFVCHVCGVLCYVLIFLMALHVCSVLFVSVVSVSP